MHESYIEDRDDALEGLIVVHSILIRVGRRRSCNFGNK